MIEKENEKKSKKKRKFNISTDLKELRSPELLNVSQKVSTDDLKKKFPHTLYIKAEKQEAVAIVLLGQMYFMDREGAIFKEVERVDLVDFPVVTGLSAGDKKSGAYLKAVASLLNAFSSVDSPLTVERLSEIHVEEDGTFTIYFNRLPFKVFFGEDDFIRKVDSLKHIIKHLRATHRLYQVRSIDLGYSNRAVVAFTKRVV